MSVLIFIQVSFVLLYGHQSWIQYHPVPAKYHEIVVLLLHDIAFK